MTVTARLAPLHKKWICVLRIILFLFSFLLDLQSLIGNIMHAASFHVINGD